MKFTGIPLSHRFYIREGKIPLCLTPREAENLRAELREEWRDDFDRGAYPTLVQVSPSRALRVAKARGCPIEGVDRIYVSEEEVNR